MSDFGLFEADTDAQQAPQRQQRQAANKLANAIYDVKDQYGPFLMGSTGKDEFEDRWHHAKNDIRKTVEAAGAFPNTGVMRRIHNAMKRDFVATLGDDNAEDPTKKPKNDGDGDSRTINDSQYKKVKDGDPNVKDDVKTNTGDGSDAEGKNPSSTTGKQSDPRDTDKYRKASARALLAENFEGDLIPDDNFEGYLDSVDQGGPEKVQRNFTDGDDSGSDRTSAREARRLAIDLYKDFAEVTGMRVSKLSTLNHYADTGIDDSTYFLLANLIRQADENCDCDDDDDTDTDGPQGSDTDSDGPPKGAAEKGGESSEDSDDDDDSDDSDSDDSGSSDDGGSESDSDSGDSDENPFAGGDEGSDAPSEDAGPPADDAGPMGDPQAPPGPPDLGPEDGGDPAGPPEAQAPPGPPQLDDAPPLAQDDFSGVDELTPDAAGQLPPDTELVQVEQIEDALGLPPGTLEQLLADSIAHGGPPQPHGAGPVASRRYVAFGEGADPAAGGQAVAPAAPAPAGPPAPAMPGPENGALLDQASQAVTNLVDQKTQEYQTIIDPLQQALQAIQFAQQVEQAENPLDVTPPEGTVDVNPQSAVDPAAQAGAASIQAPAPQTSAGPPPPGPGAPPAPAADSGGGDSGGGDSGGEKKESSLAIRRHAFKLAQYWGLSEQGYQTVLAAMSRKHYQHVAEAIQTLPPEHRMGIAASLADMFSTDNVRFNSGQFMASAGVPMGDAALHLAGNPRDRAGDSWRDGKDRRDAENEDYDTDPDNWEEREAARLGLRQGSRRPFVIRSRTTGGGRTAGETWKPPGGGQALDSFEFPGQGEKAEFSDNNKMTDLPGEKKSAGIVEDYERFDKGRTEKGLNVGGEGEVDSFLQNRKVGPRAQEKLHESVGLQPHQRAASFQPQVEGWEFDNHLNGYVSHVRQAFHCPCGQSHMPPSHGMCRCGKLWYTYAIGTGQHLANGNEAEMFLAREIPVRENVIMANRQFHSAEEYNNASGNGPFQDYAEDVEFYDDDEIDQSTPHAPGETDMDTRRSAAIEHEDPDHTDPAFGGWPFEDHHPKRNDSKKTGASYGDDDHNVVERNGEKFCSACDAMLWDPNVHHCPAKQASRSFFADWTKFTDDDNAGYDTGAEAPSTTPGKQPPKDWAKRDDKGNWVKPQFK